MVKMAGESGGVAYAEVPKWAVEKRGDALKEAVAAIRKSKGVDTELVHRLVVKFEKDPRYKKVRDRALETMKGVDMPYHGGLRHPLEAEVVALTIAVKEDIPLEDLVYVGIAAVAHEMGVAEGCKGHEERSVRNAYKWMDEAGYELRDIGLVGNMILHGTRLPQMPRGKLEEIISDADLANLGMDSFPESGELLRLEERAENKLEWLKGQQKFVESHMKRGGYFTDSARKMFGWKERENLERLKREIAMLEAVRDPSSGVR